MILTVTINPLLERRLFFHSVELGKENRCIRENFSAGGKGINVSRQLNLLGIPNHAFTFLGGNNGKILRHCITNDKIDLSVVSTKSETRSADVIIEENSNRISTFFGTNSEVNISESSDFKSKLEKMIQNCSVVVFAGSSPSHAADDIFPFGIELAKKHDKISILDTYGSHLKNCIDASPTAIHNNVSEVERSLNISLHIESNKLEYLRWLYSKGVKLAFLTDGANAAYVSKFDFHYKIDQPKIQTLDATGSGDAFVAGVAYGMEKSLVFEEFAKIAAALGAANASMVETCSVSFDQMNGYLETVTITPVGKKMKIIDDSPNY
ncbi:MAG: PfkB family carbohydrate kinase [Bacteroidota bacterium]